MHGAWSAWSTWGTCSTSCGGSGHRTRTCDNPAPASGGTDCIGDDSEMDRCGDVNCPINGNWSAWSSWGACSKSCGDGGVRWSSRTCSAPVPQYGGQACIGFTNQSEPCGDTHCPVDGSWSDWSAWSNCSKSCGGGYSTRSRTCTDPTPTYNGLQCVGDSIEIQSCGETNCPINGGWGNWSPWSHCSYSCGSSIQTRYRQCDSPLPQYDGEGCVGNDTDVILCYLSKCPVDGSWGHWSPWTACSVSCKNGTWTRQRECDSPSPQNEGLECAGINTEEEVCTMVDCPIHGNWGPWSPWSSCSSSCGAGILSKSRLCNSPPQQFGGRFCQGSNTTTLPCNIGVCPVDGNWGPWSPWSFCAITCGSGTISRSRNCDNPKPNNGGDICSGNANEEQNCLNERPCPVDGGIGPWSPWNNCDRSCGVGERSRTRLCNNPPPQNDGRICSDSMTEVASCTEHACPGTYHHNKSFMSVHKQAI